MPLALVMLRTVLLVALLSLAGRWIVGTVAGAAREGNFVYRLLSVVASPALAAARRLLPAAAPPGRAARLAFLVALIGYLAAGLWQRDLCLQDLRQAGCENWAAARGQRGS